ncbi:MAG: M4 family metallopeptidase [Anaerolineae bacterium]|nr:M4 family metallopeptidase [Anaerolineae bacterium]
MENITPEQRELLELLYQRDPEAEIEWDDVRGVAASIRGRLDIDPGLEPEGKLWTFLERFGPLVGPPDLAGGLKPLRQISDDLGWVHLLYAYLREDVELYGAKLALHIPPNSELLEVDSGLWRDVEVDLAPQIDPPKVEEILVERIAQIPGFDAFRREALKLEAPFPFTDPPRLVIYPWQGKLRLAWTTYGYGDLDEREGVRVEVPYITYGQIFVDALTGERFLFAPTMQTAETAAAGSGLAVTPLTGTHTTRTLNVVRVDAGATYRLKDTTHNRHIVTFDAACSASYDSQVEIATALKGGALPVSEDTDGDHNWNRLPANATAAERTSGQQPEVDAHHMARQQYEWYHAVAGGRDGWDAGLFPNPPVPPQVLNIVAHCRWPGGSCQDANAYQWNYKSGGTWVFWLAFMDGDNTNYDYMAGSRFIFAHEYQHAITNFSFEDASGNPGLTYSGWLGAVHEGLSDTFGILTTGDWLPGRDISRAATPQIFRNLVYPRDTACYAANKLDHFADRNTTANYYARGTILAHCAYLMGKGGVHQRAARTPQLIPVPGLGWTTVGGKDMPKAARIWYRAVAIRFGTSAAATGMPANDEQSFRTLRTAVVRSAEDLYGAGSAEHRNTILAFYAVGLHPTDTHYGPDVTFLRWGIDWDLSRAYVGLTSPNYSSLDLFVNNNGGSGWNALVNVVDPATGLPTGFENTVYCRVRNVGDQQADDIIVTFDYAKAGTATWTWLPVLDKNGNPQTLNVGSLAAGASNFADSAQNSPPAAASVKWCIPPLAPGETVDHFCLRARVTASNDVNTHNNEVQSNVAYAAYTPPAPARAAFIAGNPDPERSIRVKLEVKSSLPKGWRVSLRGIDRRRWLKPGEERTFEVVVDMPPGADKKLEPPLDGDLHGVLHGEIDERFEGALVETLLDGARLVGQFSTVVGDKLTVCGRFEGEIDLVSGEVRGVVLGPHPEKVGRKIELDLEGWLRPWRRVDISQKVGAQIIGGVTLQVQVPWMRGPFLKPPPTATRVRLP